MTMQSNIYKLNFVLKQYNYYAKLNNLQTQIFDKNDNKILTIEQNNELSFSDNLQLPPFVLTNAIDVYMNTPVVKRTQHNNKYYVLFKNDFYADADKYLCSALCHHDCNNEHLTDYSFADFSHEFRDDNQNFQFSENELNKYVKRNPKMRALINICKTPVEQFDKYIVFNEIDTDPHNAE